VPARLDDGLRELEILARIHDIKSGAADRDAAAARAASAPAWLAVSTPSASPLVIVSPDCAKNLAKSRALERP
jgi:hypothetical protein